MTYIPSFSLIVTLPATNTDRKKLQSPMQLTTGSVEKMRRWRGRKGRDKKCVEQGDNEELTCYFWGRD